MKACACGSTQIPPSRLKTRQYVCTKCYNARPSAIAARTRWIQKRRQTPAGQAYERALEARRIRYNNQHFGSAHTAEDARRIAAFVRAQVTAFKERQRGTDA